MKKIISTILTICLLCTLIASAAAVSYNSISNDQNIVTVVQDDIEYTLTLSTNDHAQLYGLNPVSTTSSATLSIKLESDENIEINNSPVIAYDSSFENAVEITDISVKSDDNSTVEIVTVEIQCTEQSDSLYVKLPSVAKVSEEQYLINSLDRSLIEEFEDNNGTKWLELTYNINDFPVAPRFATIISDIELECLFSDTYIDDNGNITGGKIVFIEPENYVLSETFDLTIIGTIEQSEPAYAEIKLN